MAGNKDDAASLEEPARPLAPPGDQPPAAQDTPNPLDTLLGRFYAERRRRPRLSTAEAQTILLYTDAKVRDMAAIYDCTPEALAAELGPWAARAFRQEGLGSTNMKEAYAALDQLEEALLTLPPLAEEVLAEASGFRFATDRIELLRLVDAIVPRVADYVVQAKKSMKLPSKRPRKEDIHELTSGLIDIHERLTDEPASCWMRSLNASPSTRFERFAKAALGGRFSAKITRDLCEERGKARQEPA